jgi:hypothetical protein
LSILTLTGKSLVPERVVLTVSMIDQLLRWWALKRDLSAQATTIFEIGEGLETGFRIECARGDNRKESGMT